jgi:hypothetical protein
MKKTVAAILLLALAGVGHSFDRVVVIEEAYSEG